MKLVTTQRTIAFLAFLYHVTIFAGRSIPLSIENRANDWHNEWAYWNKIEIVTE